ncbi:unnamed protein product [Darwinula stevensoni]|uniref:ARID domain-containing protein n=1 Tax=Darwinula stevensoni TaxID=69355 RepID=A0A7R9A9M6_9CRUS|nr:unnamed protein product [Darwinula stevensoni]CAG0897334.1 unnamed protein product [Darwinula stevensoni]
MMESGVDCPKRSLVGDDAECMDVHIYQVNGENHVLKPGKFLILKYPLLIEKRKGGDVQQPCGGSCLGKVSTIWKKSSSEDVYVTLEIYVFPEYTKQGRKRYHGKDEVVLVEENMDIMVTELPELEIQITSEWRRGYLCPLSQASRSKGHKELFFANNITDGEKEDVPLDVMVLTFVQYWRLRVLARRVASEDMEDLSTTFLAGIGIPLPGGPTKVFLSRESCLMSSLMTTSGDSKIADGCVTEVTEAVSSDHIDIDGEINLKPGTSEVHSRVWYMRATSKASAYSTAKHLAGSATDGVKMEGEMLWDEMRDENCKMAQGNINGEKFGKNFGAGKREIALEHLLPKSLSSFSSEKDAFIGNLLRFMESNKTPIQRIPSLGHKRLDLFHFYLEVRLMGGYHAVTQNKLWKTIYNALGGNKQNTSAATYTRKHYERLLLPFETHESTMLGKPYGKEYIFQEFGLEGNRDNSGSRKRSRKAKAPRKREDAIPMSSVNNGISQAEGDDGTPDLVLPHEIVRNCMQYHNDAALQNLARIACQLQEEDSSAMLKRKISGTTQEKSSDVVPCPASVERFDKQSKRGPIKMKKAQILTAAPECELRKSLQGIQNVKNESPSNREEMATDAEALDLSTSNKGSSSSSHEMNSEELLDLSVKKSRIQDIGPSQDFSKVSQEEKQTSVSSPGHSIISQAPSSLAAQPFFSSVGFSPVVYPQLFPLDLFFPSGGSGIPPAGPSFHDMHSMLHAFPMTIALQSGQKVEQSTSSCNSNSEASNKKGAA